jgi:hypothetical protein
LAEIALGVPGGRVGRQCGARSDPNSPARQANAAGATHSIAIAPRGPGERARPVSRGRRRADGRGGDAAQGPEPDGELA